MIRSAYFSPMWRNSTVGTRTTSTLPLTWLKRVGLSQVSNEWRLIFFSSALRIWAQGFGELIAVAVEVTDMRAYECVVLSCKRLQMQRKLSGNFVLSVSGYFRP